MNDIEKNIEEIFLHGYHGSIDEKESVIEEYSKKFAPASTPEVFNSLAYKGVAKDKKIKQVILIRKDLHLSIGRLLSQVCKVSHQFRSQSDELEYFDKEWFKQGNITIYLSAIDIDQLNSIYVKTMKEGIYSCKGDDLESNQTSCLAIGPYYADAIDQITRGLVLYR